MKRLMFALLLGAALQQITPAAAQQVTSTPGAADATTTVDGRYLPNPPAPFGGVINLNAKDSSPTGRPRWCRRRMRPTCC